MSDASTRDTLRYARHLVLDGVGPEGQARLRGSSVLVVGAGGLGSPVLLYLAAAGVGRIGLVEFDLVDLSNLQRQIVHGTREVGTPKIDSAARRLTDLNPDVEVVRHPERFTSANARALVRDYDLVIDGSDNFPTRYLVNDACVLEGRTFVYGAVLQWEGQVSLFGAPGGPCYRCLFREPPPAAMVQNCAEAGVFGALPGIVGSTQALEALKWLIGNDGEEWESLSGRLLLLDGRRMRWREMELRRDPGCPACGDAPEITELIDYEVFCGVRADGTPLDAPDAPPVDSIGPRELRDLLAAERPPLVVDVREHWEWEVGNLGELGAIHVPLVELQDGTTEIPAEREIVLVCSVGARSHAAAIHLRAAGRARVRHLGGGLRAWRTEIDPGLDVV